MPRMDTARIRFGVKRPALMLAALCLLSACVTDGLSNVSKMGFGAGKAPADPAAPALTSQGEVRSALITDLQSRRSVLPPDGPFAAVSLAVTEAGAGVAAAEMRVARLRAEAKAKNWLPRIGPTANLTSLGALVASILVEQTLFDNGKRKAERAYAAADVEVAAVTLASEGNKRVYDGLKHYLQAERARDQAAVAERAVERLTEFERIMSLRVDGGLSDRSEQRVLSQKLAEMHANLAADRQAEVTAMAELGAMTTRDLTRLRGLQSLPPDQPTPEPLAVTRVRGEGARTLAEADMAKADMLPGLTASAAIGKGGVDGGIGLGGGAFGVGTGATREALDATGDLVDRRTAQAAEDANRRIVTLQREMQSVQSRESEGAEVLRQTGGNLTMFTEQYKVGRRSLLELVQQYESFARIERDQVALKYIATDLRLQIALERGVLVDGARM
ncbi:MAG: TolC family protein [Pseudotabrizicola sp.]|uniref:TolC family protein n=1 Tax=Pseudotabrizicola sp. TaxID=2939647 RepID=UPI0027318911|nr:TolC family protein [Pseudotabrizicola sp.]MDP2081205.1 TolC family protein [Pseudotabrizicola sp.]MDZ7576176.1 TolC family protein [Pseudotabrizicola sp.]